MMRLLLSVNADYSTPIDEHTTPLMVAAGVGCVPGRWLEPERDVFAAVKILVDELGADVNTVNDRHETAFARRGLPGADSVIQYLVDKGAKLDVIKPLNIQGFISAGFAKSLAGCSPSSDGRIAS